MERAAWRISQQDEMLLLAPVFERHHPACHLYAFAFQSLHLRGEQGLGKNIALRILAGFFAGRLQRFPGNAALGGCSRFPDIVDGSRPAILHGGSRRSRHRQEGCRSKKRKLGKFGRHRSILVEFDQCVRASVRTGSIRYTRHAGKAAAATPMASTASTSSPSVGRGCHGVRPICPRV